MSWGKPAATSHSPNRRTTMRHLRGITEYVLVIAVLFIILSLVGTDSAFGAEAGGPSLLPTAQTYPTTGGILFPGLNVAAGVNAAAMPLLGKATAFQAGISPSLQDGDPTSFFAGLATTNKKIGLGAGYLGSRFHSNKFTSGIFAGGGFNINPVAVGVQLRDLDVQNGFSPDVDLGLVVGSGRGVEFGGVVYSVNRVPRADLGLGFGGKQYTVEANVLLPTFSNFNSDFVLTGAASVSASIFNLYLRTSYAVAPSSWEETIGALAWLTSQWNVLVQLTTSRTLTAGMTFIL